MDDLMNVGRYWAPLAVVLAFGQGQKVFLPVALSGLLTGGLKIATARIRPDATTRDSFPSGHATVVFAFAAASHGNKGILYALAVLTAVSRVYHQRHWPSDVLVGSFLGVLIGRYFS
jgi:membrane-associated phospholipid phosphatase